MWFRNLQIYQLPDLFELSAEELHEALQPQIFSPCSGLDTHRIGWTTPLGKFSDQLVHATNGRLMLCMRREDRLLPASVIREAVEEKAEIIETQESRKVGRKERSQIKEEVTVDLLPRAFTRSQLNYAYIDINNSWIIVDATSATKAEEILGLLRESLGSLRIKPLAVNQSPMSCMTDWVVNSAPADIEISDQCELKEPVEKGGVIRIRGVLLASDEVQQHMSSGKQVSKLAFAWQERLSCVLSEDLSIKRLKFLDLVLDELADTDADDAAARFDADFALMSLELSRFIPALCKLLGGVNLD